MSLFHHSVNQIEELYLDSLSPEDNDKELLGRIVGYFLFQTQKWVDTHSISTNKYVFDFDGKLYSLRIGKIKEKFNRTFHEAIIGFVLNGNPHFPTTYACEIYDAAGVDSVFHLHEYIEGLTLSEFINQKNPSDTRMKKIFKEIINAYYEIHEKYKFKHGDLHGDNIIITPDEKVVFIDLEFSYLETSDLKFGDVRVFERISNIESWRKDFQELLSDINWLFDDFQLYRNLKETLTNKLLSLRASHTGSQSERINEINRLNQILMSDNTIVANIPKRGWVFKSYLDVLNDKLNTEVSFRSFTDFANILL